MIEESEVKVNELVSVWVYVKAKFKFLFLFVAKNVCLWVCQNMKIFMFKSLRILRLYLARIVYDLDI